MLPSKTGALRVFLDGDRITPGTDGCKCGPACEMPCWQRLGLTADACCPACAPFPRCGEPTDDEIYNGPGMEGGIPYGA